MGLRAVPVSNCTLHRLARPFPAAIATARRDTRSFGQQAPRCASQRSLADTAALDPSIAAAAGLIPDPASAAPAVATRQIARMAGFDFPGPRSYETMSVRDAPHVPGMTTRLEVAFSTRHVVNEWHMRYLGGPHQHAWTETILRRYTEMAAERPLWLFYQAYGSVDRKPKSIVRHKLFTRLRRQFREALAAHGYDEHGRKVHRMEGAGGDHRHHVQQQVLDRPGDPDQLHGVVRLRTDAVELLKTPYPVLARYMSDVIERLKPTLGCRFGQKPFRNPVVVVQRPAKAEKKPSSHKPGSPQKLMSKIRSLGVRIR